MNPLYDLEKNIIEESVKKYNDMFEQIIIEGLKHKGYVFDSKQELYKFISENCHCNDNASNQNKTYYVKDVAFLFYDYKKTFEQISNNGTLTFTVNYGKYKYL